MNNYNIGGTSSNYVAGGSGVRTASYVANQPVSSTYTSNYVASGSGVGGTTTTYVNQPVTTTTEYVSQPVGQTYTTTEYVNQPVSTTTYTTEQVTQPVTTTTYTTSGYGQQGTYVSGGSGVNTATYETTVNRAY